MKFEDTGIRHVAIYLRLSRDEEGKGIDVMLKNHKETLVELAKENKWSYEIFEEIASSNSISGRPEMQKLIDKIKDSNFDAVLVMDIDRLSRNEFDHSDIKRLLFITDTLIVTPQRIYDLRKDDDSLLVGITALVANQEYKMILKRMRRGKMYAQKQGLWTNGVPPLGYDKDSKTKRLIPNERAEDIKFIFDEIVNGTTIPDLLRKLSRMGIKTRENAEFHYNGIIRLINNECYKGDIVNNRVVGKHEGIRSKDEWIVVHNAHPAIVNKEVWDKANRIVNTYSFKAPRSKNRIYPTSNLIYCGQCGKLQGCNYLKRLDKIYIKACKCGNRTYYYNPVLKKIKAKVLLEKETLLKDYRSLREVPQLNNTDYALEKLYKRLEKAKEAINVLLGLVEEGQIDIVTFKERKALRENEIKEIEAEIQDVKNADPAVKAKSLKDKISAMDELFSKWELLDGEGLSDEVINRTLHLLVDKIHWTYQKGSTEAKVEIFYK